MIYFVPQAFVFIANHSVEKHSTTVSWGGFQYEVFVFNHGGLKILQKGHTFCEVFHAVAVVFSDLKSIFLAK